jgi:hypothetical protein
LPPGSSITSSTRLLAEDPKRSVFKPIRLQDFRPLPTMVEKGEIACVVGAFRSFLGAAVDGEGANQRTMGEIQ